jgi:STE24 endopeptidase
MTYLLLSGFSRWRLLCTAAILAAGFFLAVAGRRQNGAANAATQQATRPAAQRITQYWLPPDKERTAVALARSGRELDLLEFGASVLVLFLLLRWHIAVKYRDWSECAGKWRIVQAALFTLLVLVTLDVLLLPFRMKGHVLARHYNLSVQGWPSWFADQGKGELISVVIGALLVWLANLFLRRYTPADGRMNMRRWWIPMWCIAVPLVIFGVFIEPLVIEPLFFQFRPLGASHPELTHKIEEVAARGGLQIPEQRIFEMLASQKLNELNAYVTGIGTSKRVVIWDTLLRSMNDEYRSYCLRLGSLFRLPH